MKTATAVLMIWAMLAPCGAFFPAVAQTGSDSALGVTLTNAYDAFGKEIKGTTHDFGFSAVINYRGKWILFDAGTDARIFERNLKRLKIDLRKIDIAIVSHGHYDHTGGFDYLLSVNPRVKIYAPNDFYALGAPTKFPFRETEPDVAQTLLKDDLYFRGEKAVEGLSVVPTGRFWKSNAEHLTVPKEVLPGVTVIPTVSELLGTFNRYPPFDRNPQFNGMPELSLSLATEKGDILISGCSHSTIEAIVQAAQKTRQAKIYLLTGGFHLIPYKRDYIESLAKRLKEKYSVEQVAPAHCTGHLGFSIFRQEFGEKYRFFGLGETLKF
jgi:7,8-dihydropterin-6-yl-methyl-4-(beta-D-ribofuranosyl)aminobenzene 5'-phosphate synthase